MYKFQGQKFKTIFGEAIKEKILFVGASLMRRYQLKSTALCRSMEMTAKFDVLC